MSLAIILCVLCTVCVWLKYLRVKSNKHALPPAAPGGLPIIGHTCLLFKHIRNLIDLMKSVSDDCVKQGGVTCFRFGQELYYWIVDPDDALTAANSCLPRHYVFDMAKDWLGEGLITSKGDIWKRHRKLLIPAFTLPVTLGFLDVFNSQSRKLVSLMEPHVGKKPFDHFPYLKNNALETFCIGTLGIDPLENVALTKKYMKSVDEMINIKITKAIHFWQRNDFLYRLAGLRKKEDEVLGVLRAMADTVLQKKKIAMSEKVSNNHIESVSNGYKYKPFLDLILDLSKNDALSDIEIKDELNSIILTGYETTSNQLASILVLLGAHPEVQEKVYEELLEVLGTDRDVERDDVNKLIYTNAVLMECLRLYPSVPLIFRYVPQDAKLKNYTMRAGSYCVIGPLATQLDTSWGAPSDQFKPERWLDGELRNNKVFAAFGLGKRDCIGRTYAMISMKVTLAHFVRRYRVTADMSKLKMKYEFILKPAGGYEINIERRT